MGSFCASKVKPVSNKTIPEAVETLVCHTSHSLVHTAGPSACHAVEDRFHVQVPHCVSTLDTIWNHVFAKCPGVAPSNATIPEEMEKFLCEFVKTNEPAAAGVICEKLLVNVPPFLNVTEADCKAVLLATVAHMERNSSCASHVKPVSNETIPEAVETLVCHTSRSLVHEEAPSMCEAMEKRLHVKSPDCVHDVELLWNKVSERWCPDATPFNTIAKEIICKNLKENSVRREPLAVSMLCEQVISKTALLLQVNGKVSDCVATIEGLWVESGCNFSGPERDLLVQTV